MHQEDRFARPAKATGALVRQACCVCRYVRARFEPWAQPAFTLDGHGNEWRAVRDALEDASALHLTAGVARPARPQKPAPAKLCGFSHTAHQIKQLMRGRGCGNIFFRAPTQWWSEAADYIWERWRRRFFMGRQLVGRRVRRTPRRGSSVRRTS